MYGGQVTDRRASRARQCRLRVASAQTDLYGIVTVIVTKNFVSVGAVATGAGVVAGVVAAT